MDRFKEEGQKLSSEMLVFISTSLSYVAALAWNEAFRTLFQYYFEKGEWSHLKEISTFIYAIAVTFIAILFVRMSGVKKIK